MVHFRCLDLHERFTFCVIAFSISTASYATIFPTACRKSYSTSVVDQGLSSFLLHYNVGNYFDDCRTPSAPSSHPRYCDRTILRSYSAANNDPLISRRKGDTFCWRSSLPNKTAADEPLVRSSRTDPEAEAIPGSDERFRYPVCTIDVPFAFDYPTGVNCGTGDGLRWSIK